MLSTAAAPGRVGSGGGGVGGVAVVSAVTRMAAIEMVPAESVLASSMVAVLHPAEWVQMS